MSMETFINKTVTDNLRRICAHYGWNADQWDDGVRTN